MQYVTPTNSPRNSGLQGTPGSLFSFSPASFSSFSITGPKQAPGTPCETPIEAANSLLNFSFEGALSLAGSRPSTPISQLLSAFEFTDLDPFAEKENVPPIQENLTTSFSIEKNETLEPVIQLPVKEDVQVKTLVKPGGYRKRSFCEIDDDEDWSFLGLDFLEREEDEKYKYPCWTSKPRCGAYKPNKGPPSVSMQRANVNRLLLNDAFQRSKLFQIIKYVAESGENDFVSAGDFCEKHDIRPEQWVSRSRCYEKWVVFHDPRMPFITHGRPQALDYRINKHAMYSMKRREVRLMPLYLEEYNRLFI